MVTFEEAIARARQAQENKDFAAALGAWDGLAADFPDRAAGAAGASALLREMGRLDEAEQRLAAAAERFPEDERIAVEQAWVVHQRADWSEADRRWRALRARFPQSTAAFHGGGAALRALQQFAEAESIYEEAVARWPDSFPLRADYASLALARGDLAEADRRFRLLQDTFPDRPASYLRPAQDLRAAGHLQAAMAMLTEASGRFPGNPNALVESARIADQRGDAEQALQRWEQVVTHLSDRVEGYVGAGKALCDLGRFGDAQTLLQPALRKFPNSPDAAALYARIAQQQRDFPEALRRWENFRVQFPAFGAGFTGAMWTLVTMSRLDDAAALMDQAIVHFPHDYEVRRDWARVSELVQDWHEAARRWAKVAEIFPAASEPRSRHAEALAKTGQQTDAEAMLEAAIAEKGGDIVLHSSYANCAMQRGDWPAAEARWRHAAERMPQSPVPLSGIANVFARAGRFAEAEQVLAEALARFPNHYELRRQHAQLATTRRDWPEAMARWEALKRANPRNQGVRNEIAQTVAVARQELELAAAEGLPAPFEIPESLLTDDAPEDLAEIAALLMKFESIGDTCEFGIVQRRFGAEPIGLLRWTSTSPADLVRAFNNRFEGVGEAEHTTVEVAKGEYVTRDRRYSMFSHTFTPQAAAPFDHFTRQHLRRVQYLRRKFLDDLETGEKILVYKCENGLTDREALAIHRAARAYGGNTALLCVRLADDAHPTGSLELLDESLFVGYIDRFSTVNTNFTQWVDLCRRTDALWNAPDSDREAERVREAGRAAWAAREQAGDEGMTMSLSDYAGLAREAMDKGDPAAALAAWEAARARFPEDPMGYAGAAALLRELNRPDTAEALLVQACVKFPEEESIATEYAWVAHHRDDWPEADRRWALLRTRFPAAFGGYFGGGTALRVLRRFEEAEKVYKASLERWPDHRVLLADFAMLAAERGDRAAAAERFAALRARHPFDPEGYVGEIRSLRATAKFEEAERVAAEATALFPDKPEILIESAYTAKESGQPDAALARWQAVLAKAPERPDGHLGLAHALESLGRFDEAETALALALAAAPDWPEAAWLSARIAHGKGDFQTALARWAAYRDQFPDDPAGYVGAMWSESARDDRHAADVIITDAMARFPGNPEVAMDWAHLPERFQDWNEASRRRAEIAARFPENQAIAGE